jgi:hypothetical protein
MTSIGSLYAPIGYPRCRAVSHYHALSLRGRKLSSYQQNNFLSGHIQTTFTSLQVLQNGCHMQRHSLSHMRVTLNLFK